jgi:hypothetical protein
VSGHYILIWDATSLDFEIDRFTISLAYGLHMSECLHLALWMQQLTPFSLSGESPSDKPHYGILVKPH